MWGFTETEIGLAQVEFNNTLSKMETFVIKKEWGSFGMHSCPTYKQYYNAHMHIAY